MQRRLVGLAAACLLQHVGGLRGGVHHRRTQQQVAGGREPEGLLVRLRRDFLMTLKGIYLAIKLFCAGVSMFSFVTFFANTTWQNLFGSFHPGPRRRDAPRPPGGPGSGLPAGCFLHPKHLQFGEFSAKNVTVFLGGWAPNKNLLPIKNNLYGMKMEGELAVCQQPGRVRTLSWSGACPFSKKDMVPLHDRGGVQRLHWQLQRCIRLPDAEVVGRRGEQRQRWG